MKFARKQGKYKHLQNVCTPLLQNNIETRNNKKHENKQQTNDNLKHPKTTRKKQPRIHKHNENNNTHNLANEERQTLTTENNAHTTKHT